MEKKTEMNAEPLKHYLKLGVLFIGLFTVSIFSLELWEGRKVITTSYLGLKNAGFSVILVLSLLSGFVVFFSIFLPLTYIFDKFPQSLMIKLPISLTIGCLGGLGIFNTMYGSQAGYLIKEYELNSTSSILIFGLAAFIYALMEHYLMKRALSSKKFA